MLLVEDDPAMQLRLRSILMDLGYEAEALVFSASIAEARALLHEQPFAMAVIDLGLPDGNGIDLIRWLHGADAALPILVVSTWSTEQIIVTALQAGATGYMLKDRDDAEIALSVRSALRGGAPIDPFVARRILQLLGPGREGQAAAPSMQLATPLSPRETEILQLVSKGLTNLEISHVLTLSRLTVECHIKNIYKKLSVRSRTEALFEARAHGLLQ